MEKPTAAAAKQSGVTAGKAAHSGSVAANAAEREPVKKAITAAAKQGGAADVKEAASVSSPAAAAEQKSMARQLHTAVLAAHQRQLGRSPSAAKRDNRELHCQLRLKHPLEACHMPYLLPLLKRLPQQARVHILML